MLWRRNEIDEWEVEYCESDIWEGGYDIKSATARFELETTLTETFSFCELRYWDDKITQNEIQ